MILIVTNEKLNISKAFKTPSLELIEGPGLLTTKYGFSKNLNSEVLIFLCTQSPTYCLVGLNWITQKYSDIKLILFIGLFVPTNSYILDHHLLIPNYVAKIDEIPLEWSKKNEFETIKCHEESITVLRSAIHNSNLDFHYGSISSAENLTINKPISKLLFSEKFTDGIDSLSFYVNFFGQKHSIKVMNICIANLSHKLHSIDNTFRTTFNTSKNKEKKISRTIELLASKLNWQQIIDHVPK